MHLYSADYLILFLPVFMGVYALLPAPRRPAAIALANVIFLATAGEFGLIGFFITLASAYFSGISIYNMRGRPEKQQLRKRLLGANIILYVLGFVFFAITGTGGLKRTLLDPASVYCHAVIPLHLISYLLDIYRGGCEAETSVMSLMAYAGFFPSASFGPVLRYKCFANSFRAPRITAAKLTPGVRLYIFGLAEYLLIARQLESVRTEIVTAPDSLRSGTAWLFVPVFYVMFAVSLMSLLNMGRGTAMMLGFYVRPRRRLVFFEPSIRRCISHYNEPLAKWFGDYLTKPAAARFGNVQFAVMLSVCAGALWFRLSIGWLLTGLAAAAAVIIRGNLYEKNRKLPKAVNGLITKLFMLALIVLCAFLELPSAGFAIFGSARGGDASYTLHLIRESIIPLTAGAAVISPLPFALVRKMKMTWIRSLMPIIDAVLLVLCISFIVNTV